MGCYFTHMIVGPNVIIQCSCGKLHIVKRKENASEAVKVAFEHVRSTSKYGTVHGPSNELVWALRRKHKAQARASRGLRVEQSDNRHMQHGVKRS